MSDKDGPRLPPPSAEDQRVAARNFEYANRASAAGNFDLAISMLRTCCQLVPAKLEYRQALRKAQKARWKGTRNGSFFAPLTTWMTRLKMIGAGRKGQHRKVLEYGEAILAKNPWDRSAHLHMAEAAATLGLPTVAVWILQEGRERKANDVALNRALARLLEKQGLYQQAMAVWGLVLKAVPTDREAMTKSKQMAVDDTIARGLYEEPAAAAAAAETAETSATRTAVERPSEAARATQARDRVAQEVETLRGRIEANPKTAEPYLQLAAHLVRQKHHDEAQVVLEQGLEATGNAPELRLAHAEHEIEAFRRTLARTDEQLKATPRDDKLIKAREKLLRKIAALDIGYYRQRIEMYPADKSNHYELGVRLYEAGQIEDAIPELQAARADNRLHWKALLGLGRCFQARQNWPLAKRNFEEALKNLPDAETEQKKEILFHLAEGHANAGDLGRAVELAVDLADLDYAYRNIGQLLEDWQRRLQAGSSRPR
ncbi:MAG: hypothetical protein U0736_24450 [Gemmataceae bacterium]